MLSNMVLKISSVVILASVVTACATPPQKVRASYVSQLEYSDHNCRQIKGELIRVNRRVIEATGTQQKAANKDAVVTGVTLLLFWPAVFLLDGNGNAEELARLKGESDALESVAIQKGCGYVKRIAAR